jgi:hypothetical protein
MSDVAGRTDFVAGVSLLAMSAAKEASGFLPRTHRLPSSETFEK